MEEVNFQQTGFAAVPLLTNVQALFDKVRVPGLALV